MFCIIRQNEAYFIVCETQSLTPCVSVTTMAVNDLLFHESEGTCCGGGGRALRTSTSQYSTDDPQGGGGAREEGGFDG